MAQTWHGTTTSSLPADWSAHTAGSGRTPAWEIRRAGDRFVNTTTLPSGASITLPVEVIMGGARHGLGFLPRIEGIDGIPLERSTLIQGRYSWSLAKQTLMLAPASPEEVPKTYQTAIGLVLSTGFEDKCLVCHGKPGTLGAGKAGGVHCESCHGPGWPHLQAAAKGKPRSGILNPKNLTVDQRLAVCAPCHTGFSNLTDPLPDELLVSNQVNGLKESECFIQSGKALQCTTCHDPHKESTHDADRTVPACLGCHAETVKGHAAVCPVNARGECVGCHMPAIERGSFHLVDHWIRVHPEQNVKAAARRTGGRSQEAPRREFLRAIVTKTRAGAETANKRLENGEAFFDVAREMSTGSASALGGYLGAQRLAQMEPQLSAGAAGLAYGQRSAIISTAGANGERWTILERLPRDFRLEAGQLVEQARALGLKGDRAGALAKCRQALRLDPHSERALLFLAKSLGENGEAPRALNVLKVAQQFYPKDADVQFEMGSLLGRAGQRVAEIAAYRRAIELEPDLVSAYVKLGIALYSDAEWKKSEEAFRQGLRADSLSPALYYGLSLVLQQQGDKAGAKRALALAAKIDPEFVRNQPRGTMRRDLNSMACASGPKTGSA